MFGLEPAGSFDDITSNGDLADLLEFLYGDVSDVDAWVGALAEDHAPGAAVGELVLASLADQFGRLRDGDRFWFEYDSALSADEIDLLSNTTLADIILRNTGITTLQSNVFFVPEPATLLLLSLAGVMMTRRRCAYFGKP
jgi:hypothetical protein